MILEKTKESHVKDKGSIAEDNEVSCKDSEGDFLSDDLSPLKNDEERQPKGGALKDDIQDEFSHEDKDLDMDLRGTDLSLFMNICIYRSLSSSILSSATR